MTLSLITQYKIFIAIWILIAVGFILIAIFVDNSVITRILIGSCAFFSVYGVAYCKISIDEENKKQANKII